MEQTYILVKCSKTLKVSNSGTSYSESDRPACALFKAPQSFAPSPHMHTW